MQSPDGQRHGAEKNAKHVPFSMTPGTDEGYQAEAYFFGIVEGNKHPDRTCDIKTT
jgi:hypothetical protein